MSVIFKSLFEILVSLVKLAGFYFPIWAIPLIMYIIMRIRYKQSIYYEITKKRYLSMRRDLGAYGEYLTYKYLSKLKGDKRFLFNCYIPKEDGTTSEIDVILIHNSGIYVFESKNYSGWIFGSETQGKWTQTLPAGRYSHKEHFLNPIIQNKSHIKHLKTYLGEDAGYPYHSIIVFSERCTLKDITLNSNEIKVIKRNHLRATVQNIIKSSPTTLSAEQVDETYKLLFPFTQKTEEDKIIHIQNIQDAAFERSIKKYDQQEKIYDAEQNSNPECPKCGAIMLLREATRGERKGQKFYGCSNFPNCKETINIPPSPNNTENESI